MAGTPFWPRLEAVLAALAGHGDIMAGQDGCVTGTLGGCSKMTKRWRKHFEKHKTSIRYALHANRKSTSLRRCISTGTHYYFNKDEWSSGLSVDFGGSGKSMF